MAIQQTLQSASNGAISTRQVTLLHLKTNGPSTARSIADELGVSPMAVRIHLHRLVGEGLVSVQQKRQGVGRPAHVYSLTEAAEELFPTAYEDLIELLMDSLETLGGKEAVQAIMKQYFQRAIKGLRVDIEELSPAERLELLAAERNREGYMAKVFEDDDGQLRLQQHHCAIARLVKNHPDACDIEADVFQSFVGEQNLVRTQCLRDGDGVCEYVLKT